MKTRSEFSHALAELDLSVLERAIALLWYYRETQQFEERSASELAGDMDDDGFPRPNVTRLDRELRRSRDTRRGERDGTFQIDVRAIPRLAENYGALLHGTRVVQSEGRLLPKEMVAGTRQYLEQLVHQINASYESGLYDAAAVLCRRLMESLIIEVYVSRGRHAEIQINGGFIPLDRLMGYIKNDGKVVLNKASPSAMDAVKALGDTAAHNRTYITKPADIDDLKARYRRLIDDLLHVSGVR